MSFKSNFLKMLQRSRGGIGQWCVIRHFSEIRSKYWNEETQESVGGPPNEYQDTVILASKQLSFGATNPPGTARQETLQAVNISRDSFVYYMDTDVEVEIDDEIFDLDYAGQVAPTVKYTSTDTGAAITGRFKVDFVNNYRVGNRGEKTYKIVTAKRYHGE
jgi:hypothetical protein